MITMPSLSPLNFCYYFNIAKQPFNCNKKGYLLQEGTGESPGIFSFRDLTSLLEFLDILIIYFLVFSY